MNYIKKKIKYYSRKAIRYTVAALVALFIIFVIIMIKYKPVYSVVLNGKELGLVNNKAKIESEIAETTESPKGSVLSAILKDKPQYDLKFIAKNAIETKDDEVFEEIDEKIDRVYKTYNIKSGDQVLANITSKEEADKIIAEIKTEREFENLQVVEFVTKDKPNENTDEAKQVALAKVVEIQEAEKAKREEMRRIAMAKAKKEVSRGNSGGRVATGSRALRGKTFVRPVPSRRYGARYLGYKGHGGTDLLTGVGTSVRSAASGVVVKVKDCGNRSYGKYIVVDHGNGISTLYAHCSAINKTRGQRVEAGEVIARSGSTGNSTGPHLHFEIRVNGRHINPEPYI